MAKKILSGVFIVVAMVIFGSNSAWSWFGQKKEAIKIGAILPLSGASSQVGEAQRNGMMLAIDEINSWGGINARKIELIIKDSKTDKQEGKKAFEKIEAAHHPLIYISSLSTVSLELVPPADENKVVVVGLAATAPELTKQSKWVFRYFSLAENQVPPMLSILEELQVKKLGMIYINDEYGRSFFELARKGFERTGGIIRGEPYDGKKADFKEQIAKLKDTSAIYVVVRSDHLKDIFKQLKEEGFIGVIVAAGNVSVPSIKDLAEANGIYLVSPIIYHPNFLYAKKVGKRYEAKYGKPFDHYAANGYDIIKLLAGILEDEEIERNNMKRLLEEGFIYHGIFGEIILNPGERNINFPLYPAQIIDGRIKYTQ
ncbi:MAG: ABC transporter substrate-binding protein [Candidatus Omnitrophica bacterium]|nr:ABC transporter substrate-binding protein [Candidatus Omnitrophota bacterium]